MRWKPEMFAKDMYDKKVNEKFYFSSDEFLKPSQIRSYFSRLASKRKNSLESHNDIHTIPDGEESEALKDECAIEENNLFLTVRKLYSPDESTSDDKPRSLKRPSVDQSEQKPK